MFSRARTGAVSCRRHAPYIHSTKYPPLRPPPRAACKTPPRQRPKSTCAPPSPRLRAIAQAIGKRLSSVRGTLTQHSPIVQQPQVVQQQSVSLSLSLLSLSLSLSLSVSVSVSLSLQSRNVRTQRTNHDEAMSRVKRQLPELLTPCLLRCVIFMSITTPMLVRLHIIYHTVTQRQRRWSVPARGTTTENRQGNESRY